MGSSLDVHIARIHRLDNPVQHYAWGSRVAIPELLGRPTPAAEPWAELWMGAHPAAVSRVTDGSGSEALDAYIAKDPEAVLGAATAARFGGKLPFLFKVLAAAEPLSIQAHPSLAQARAGFARESAEGLALNDPRRCYRDANHKPELICALTPFFALNRFRDPAEIADRLAALGAPRLDAPIDRLRRRPDRDGLASFFEELWLLDAASRAAVIECATVWAKGRDESDSAARWIALLAQRYPSDIGVVAPLLLNVVELAPGEAMFLPSGELHSYLDGMGVEIMANSDNVLRGGLTGKHIAVPELLRTLTFRSGPIERLRPRRSAAEDLRYETPADEFALGVIEARPDAPWSAPSERAVEILLCTRGSGVIEAGEAREPHSVARGDSFLVPAAVRAYAVRGDLTLYRATPGDRS